MVPWSKSKLILSCVGRCVRYKGPQFRFKVWYRTGLTGTDSKTVTDTGVSGGTVETECEDGPRNRD